MDFLKQKEGKGKIVFCLLLIVVTIFCAVFSSINIKKVYATSGYWTDYVSKSLSYYYDSGLRSYVYVIDKAEDLALVAKKINGGEQAWRNRKYKLRANIDLSAHYWVPIANYWNVGETFYYFYGIFDGNGCTISGMNIARDDTSGDHARVGLFGNVCNGTIKNLVVAGVDMWGNAYSGAISGCIQSSTVENCIVRDSTIQGYNPYGTVYVGGFFGVVRYTSLTKCWALGNTIIGHDTSGSALYAGGIVGKVWGQTDTGVMSTLDTCCNYGGDVYTITYAENDAYAGGIAGVANYTSINKCFNTATICAGITTGGTDVARAGAGGIAGWIENSASITNCYNTGAISSNARLEYGTYTPLAIGNTDVEFIGVSGSGNNVSLDWHTAYIRDTSVSSKGQGNYSGAESLTYGQPFARNGFSGGIAGYSAESTMVTNCYNIGAISGGSYSQYYRVGAKMGWKSGLGNIQFRRKIVSHLSYTLTSYASGICGYNAGTVSNCYKNAEIYSRIDAYQLINDENGGEERSDFGSTCGYYYSNLTFGKSAMEHGFSYALGYSNNYYNFYFYYVKDSSTNKYLHDTKMYVSDYCLALDIDLTSKSNIYFRYIVAGNGATIYASSSDSGFIITDTKIDYKEYLGNYYSIPTGLASDGKLATVGTYKSSSSMNASSFSDTLNSDVFVYSKGKNSGYPVIKDFYWDLNTEYPQ